MWILPSDQQGIRNCQLLWQLHPHSQITQHDLWDDSEVVHLNSETQKNTKNYCYYKDLTFKVEDEVNYTCWRLKLWNYKIYLQHQNHEETNVKTRTIQAIHTASAFQSKTQKDIFLFSSFFFNSLQQETQIILRSEFSSKWKVSRKNFHANSFGVGELICLTALILSLKHSKKTFSMK